jgi:hypothetical protein
MLRAEYEEGGLMDKTLQTKFIELWNNYFSAAELPLAFSHC